MSQSMSEGFKLWRQEVYTAELGKADEVPYIALLPLIGIYVSAENQTEPTSQSWRTTVLADGDAMQGLHYTLNAWSCDLSETHQLPISNSQDYVSGQANRIYESIHDGLRPERTTMPWNEEFLAKHLGLAVHDDAVRLQPLRLLDQGLYAVESHYPITAHHLRAQV